ncbi:tyrosine-protein kinase Etk/Wzc [Parabacteroides sp. PFB2-10]|uniref:GumC family protein n=1 Tax=Parabacteroides sp. PFB2-10 TaxID=1742405 RepID=UPI00247438EB|nr:polysaccharide biosynthesis tyrosine autokinase [Parabacteroides sp. PFB2-10]MDH6312723.1 tyrosine-protein kinase Etk/Wzc [Parabacteroides sp. PFB2-10]
MERKEEEQFISLVDIVHIVVGKWYWFVLSIILCLGAAFLYLKITPKEYTRTASVLIKDDSRSGGASEAAAFEELSMFNMKRNVDNEVLVFKSRRLMRETARKLNLDVSYTVKEALRTQELYTRAPISASFPEVDEMESFSFVATLTSDKEVSLTDFRIITESGEELYLEESYKTLLNDTLQTAIGPLVVTPTLYFTDSYLHTPVTVLKQRLESVVTRYQSALQVSLASKTATIIDLTLQDVSIARAEDVLNTLIDVYNADVVNDKNQIMVNTSEFINERLIIIEKELGSVDSDIESFKREHQLTDIQSESGMYLQTTSQLSQEELALENQLSLAKYIREYLTAPTHSSDLIPSNTGLSDMNIEGQIASYNELLLKRDKLIGNSSSKNPVVMDLNNSLSAMKQTIIRAIDNLIAGLNLQIGNVKQREVQTARRISAVPSQQKEVLSIERQQKIKEELYLYLLNKREENALSQAMTESNARIVDAASGSNIPVAPKAAVILLAAFLLGCIIPGGVIWMQNTLDTKVKGRKDLEEATTIPLLGEIPHRDKKENGNDVVVRKESRDSVSEAFRIIRTNMEFMRVKAKDMKVVMFTSSSPGSGKTFISTNLAVSLALTNKRVILVDLDIRKGTLSDRVGYKGQGITNFLSGRVDHVDDIIQHGYLEDNLDVLHVGPVPPNPAELLLSNRLEALIELLKRRYDYIILDTVPAGIVADASIINRVADITVYVVRAGLLDRRQLPDIERLYREDRYTNMCTVLNDIRYDKTGYRYGYGYTYGYGYSKEEK